ncbi:MAG: hypothetical protein ABIF17_00285 [Patescibacteria group bacterium]
MFKKEELKQMQREYNKKKKVFVFHCVGLGEVIQSIFLWKCVKNILPKVQGLIAPNQEYQTIQKQFPKLCLPDVDSKIVDLQFDDYKIAIDITFRNSTKHDIIKSCKNVIN